MNPNHPGKAAVGVPSTVDPVDLALKRACDAPVEPDVMRFLRKHERLVEAQIAHLGRERWRHILIMSVGLCVLGAIISLMWDASRARGVAIEPFRVPSEMQTRGLDGAVVATQVMDQLLKMQDATESLRAPSTYSNNWGDDIAVEIPNTGITIGDLRSSLRAWLGKQVRLSGELVRRGDGSVALTVRVGTSAGTQFEGPESELDTLIARAAETVYEQTQPYRFTIWLRNSGRSDEAQDRMRDLVHGSNREDRLWALNSMAARAGDPSRSIPILERGLRLDPTFTPFLYNMAVNLSVQGRERETLAFAKRFLALQDLAREQINPSRHPALIYEMERMAAQLQMDLPRACAMVSRQMETVVDRTTRLANPLTLAACEASARDVPAAREVLAARTNDEDREAIEALSPDWEVDSVLAEFLDDWESMYVILRAVEERMPAEHADALLTDQSLILISRLAMAAAWTDRIDEARERIASTPLDCAFCVRSRGTIEALAGDATAANRWFDAAQALASRLPSVYGERAQALLILKDWPAAIQQAHIAARLAPNWVDPKKFWGDALLEQGKFTEALMRYRQAEKLAPNWGALKIAMGKAYLAASKPERAREYWEKAARLPLSPQDRAALDRLLSG